MHVIRQLVQDNMNYGLGQAIISFGAWLYVLILLVIVVYYAVLSVIRRFLS